MNIKDRLKKLREEKGIYQKDLAKELFISRDTIASYETGKSCPSIEILLRYANYFNCSTDYILGRTNKRNLKDDNNDTKKLAIELLEKMTNEIKQVKGLLSPSLF